MELFLWTFLGAFLLGMVEAIFGALKDTLWEGFSWLTFVRSHFLIVAIAVILFGPMRVWGGWDVLIYVNILD
ncbi:MAG: hypothetical protein A3J68_01880 [Candidatus Wildermuthbacteria bacterium RIFCSPHIGHO2_02_FULL_48_16]|uniref:Uncharacterized protein n=1 Tax=Candidatus Wildermuthbacteria bacterium RIFCSPHIGHO2_02_FULL_48_16 TaxID=1802453 RepID=A0A1G2R7R9_9BACT|nr:MAG: hypothetical protein A3J68_01880 [Candidatus Wildermuthbacteria bacterium RIFCSPHIGHO2_02_FULL_48_16]